MTAKRISAVVGRSDGPQVEKQESLQTLFDNIFFLLPVFLGVAGGEVFHERRQRLDALDGHRVVNRSADSAQTAVTFERCQSSLTE